MRYVKISSTCCRLQIFMEDDSVISSQEEFDEKQKRQVSENH